MDKTCYNTSIQNNNSSLKGTNNMKNNKNKNTNKPVIKPVKKPVTKPVIKPEPAQWIHYD